MGILVLGGFLAGTLIAILMVLLEHSRIALNSYALFGNGALIVPVLLAPFALYPGWVWTLRRGDTRSSSRSSSSGCISASA